MSSIPEWANKWKRKGTVLRATTGGKILMYSNKSVRVPGKKYPQPVQKYIGVVTESGVIEDFSINTDDSGITVWEYGFSRVIETLAPIQFMKELGGEERAKRVLCCIITKLSPNSYLLKDRLDWCDALEGTNLSLQRKKLFSLMGRTEEELEEFKRIYLLDIGGRTVISGIRDIERKKLTEMGVIL
ncbi:MAG: hypothetical protein GX903_10105 [Spirochaetales bacterium]|nr:hypothetical protein [Spirochaetales bacterium]